MRTKNFVFKAVIVTVFAAMFMAACANPFLYKEDEKAPGTPTGLTITVATGSITVSWNPVSGATGYNIYRSTYSSSGFIKVGTSDTASFIDTTILAGTTYYYKVLAYNNAGESEQTEPVSKMTVPAAPTGLAKTSVTSTSITLNWSAATGASGYYLYRSTSSDGTFAKLDTGTLTTNSYTNTGLSANTPYYYKVSAYNANGESPQSSAYVSVTTAPDIPADLTKTAATSTSITLSWSAVTGATGYYIYRSTTSTGTFTQVGSLLTTTSYTDTGLTASTAYYYKVAANNTNGTGTQSAYISVTTMLATPTGLATIPATSTSITISWNSVTEATGYYLYRSTSSEGPFDKLDTGTLTTTSYTDDNGILTNTTYYYKVAAYNSAGESSLSDAVSQNNGSAPAVPTGLTKTAATSISITISWSSVTGATGYRIFRSASSTGTFAQVGTSTTTSYTDTGLTAGTTYYYEVAAYNSDNGTGYQSAAFSATTMGIPTGLVTTGATYNSISISWNSVTDATGYYIYRSSSSTGTFTQVGTSTTTSYTNTGLSGGTIYFYKVAAYNSFGMGSQSTAVSQQTQYSSSYTLSISGTPRIGQGLTVSTGGTGWTDSTITWCYASSAEGDLESDGRRHFYAISSGTATSFTIPATYNGVSMVGKYIRAFRRHPSGTWLQGSYNTFPSNFIGPIQSNN